MSTHQHQLKAHCINRKQRTAAARYIDKLEGKLEAINGLLTLTGCDDAMGELIGEAMTLMQENHTEWNRSER